MRQRLSGRAGWQRPSWLEELTTCDRQSAVSLATSIPVQLSEANHIHHLFGHACEVMCTCEAYVLQKEICTHNSVTGISTKQEMEMSSDDDTQKLHIIHLCEGKLAYAFSRIRAMWAASHD